MRVIFYCLASLLPLIAAASDKAEDKTLTVAAVQMRSSRSLPKNLAQITNSIAASAAKGAQVVIFPECALTGYFEDTVTNTTAVEIADASKIISDACKRHQIYAIVGSAFRDGEKLLDSALVFAASGKLIERYDKLQLAEKWPKAGDHLSVFRIGDVPCSIIICHDERYPELVRLPVLAGARVLFYISHESGLNEEKKIGPYRAQIQARAVENGIYVVQANAPANQDKSGSHGQSRIIAPDGNIIKEASIYNEELVLGSLDVSKATADNAKKSLTRGPLQDWWKEGLKRVRIIE
jgi:predicted amidohydrolase